MSSIEPLAAAAKLPPLYRLQAKQIQRMVNEFPYRLPVMNCSAPGAGKTRIAIETCLREKGRRGIIVAPTLVVQQQWVEELAAFGIDAMVVPSAKKFDPAYEGWLVVSYASIRTGLNKPLMSVADSFTHIIFDEAHHLRDWKNKTCRGWESFRYNGKAKVIMLTATPVENAVHWCGLLRAMGNRQDANAVYRLLKWREFALANGRVFPKCVGWTDEAAAKEIVRRNVVRYGPKEVYADMPATLTRRVLRVPISEKQLKDAVLADIYAGDGDAMKKGLKHAALDDFFADAKAEPNPQQLAIIGAVLRKSAELKVAPLSEHIAEVAGQEPVAVFFHHTKPLKEMRERLAKAGLEVSCLMGTSNMTQREQERELGRFRDRRAQVFLATHDSGGVGINLHIGNDGERLCAHSVIAELPWRALSLTQSLGRCYRTGVKWPVRAEVAVGQGKGAMLKIESRVIRALARKCDAAESSGLEDSLAMPV